MNCPKCKSENVKEMFVEGVHLDFCRGCKGIWFDEGELAFYTESNVDVADFVETSKSAVETKYECPKCDDEKLLEFKYHTEEELLIDFCNGCRGVFLDKLEVAHAEKIVKKYGLTKFTKIIESLKSNGYEVV